MIARWEQGRADIDELLARQSLDRVTASRELADAMLGQAELHLDSARLLSTTDAPGSFQLAYDAARKSLAAILANQGLRAKGAGAHATLYQAARAQLHPPLGPAIDSFDWMRRLRNATEYPDLDKPIANLADVEEAIPAAQKIVETARRVLDQMPVY
ncbi:HEPN domain-containing protein [Homoserinimonas sp. A520]